MPRRFEAGTGTETHAGMLVQHDQQATFALLLEQLGVQLAAARGESPVEPAHVVAGLVGP